MTTDTRSTGLAITVQEPAYWEAPSLDYWASHRGSLGTGSADRVVVMAG